VLVVVVIDWAAVVDVVEVAGDDESSPHPVSAIATAAATRIRRTGFVRVVIASFSQPAAKLTRGR